jgi:BirA family biotin operon repressor/biotin-[acetyl-CoA-carboxylase] ligase
LLRSIESILKVLASASEPVSGETLAKRLGVSRTAVWKGIQLLKAQGFEIEARPGVGYMIRSFPDRLLPELVGQDLHTRIVGCRIVYFDTTDSTNLQAKTMAVSGEKEGTVVLAEKQTSGRGRLNRSWVSPRGENLLFSVIFRPSWPPVMVFRLTMMASLSLVEAISALTTLSPLIKWPNDLYVENKKLAGILTEFSGSADVLEYAVVGVGLNVNFDPNAAPEIAQIATSIAAETGESFPRLMLLQEILRRMDLHYHHLIQGQDRELRERWNSLSMVVGKEVSVSSFNGEEQGKALFIDEEGALIIQDNQGQTRRILCGDVSLRLT